MKIIKKWLKRGLFLLLLSFLLLVGAGYVQYRIVIGETPLTEAIANVQASENYVFLEDIDPFFLQAVVAVEDRRFYQRQGLDIRSLGRAVWTNLKNFDFLEGGSTIGQQVGKNLYFDFRFNVLRKIAEVFLLYDIEKTISKDETLELYVNMNYYGDGYTGIKRASVGYFGKLPSELSLGQSSLLAGLPQSPSRFQLSNHFERAKARQKKVLGDMVDLEIITQQQADEIYMEDVYE
ncbi:MAG: transglycosylase domain-containing protein [Erysipelotrichaceae bacterium]|nr:transglycosylase domain-containing protein [Erysipelotrichaceae bacterium]MDP3306364.1 transglycosylase domain-containing protein [Erysipelotrichaceae bacterium]